MTEHKDDEESLHNKIKKDVRKSLTSLGTSFKKNVKNVSERISSSNNIRNSSANTGVSRSNDGDDMTTTTNKSIMEKIPYDDIRSTLQRFGESTTAVVKSGVKLVDEKIKESRDNSANSNDVYTASVEEGLIEIKKLIQNAKNNKKERRPQKFNFVTVPLVNNKSLDDLYLSFLYWSMHIDEDSDDDYDNQTINTDYRPNDESTVHQSKSMEEKKDCSTGNTSETETNNKKGNDDGNIDDYVDISHDYSISSQETNANIEEIITNTSSNISLEKRSKNDNLSTNSSSLATSTRANTSSDINVSKAFRRLEAYASWMDQTGRDLIDPPLTMSSIENVWKLWNMKVSFNKNNDLVWWFDLTAMDIPSIKKEIRDVDAMRMMVWFLHYIVFDALTTNATTRQGDDGDVNNEIIFVHNIGYKNFWNGYLFTGMSPQMRMRIEYFLLYCMPIRIKHTYYTQIPAWMKVMSKIVKVNPFMSNNTKSTITFVDKEGKEEDKNENDNDNKKEASPKNILGASRSKDQKDESFDILIENLGIDCMPKGFGGKLMNDYVAEKYFTSNDNNEIITTGADEQNIADNNKVKFV